MMLDMLAAVARKDYEDRRRRQVQGIAKAKSAATYRGRPEDTDRNAGIAGMLRSGMSWTEFKRRRAAAGRPSLRSASGRRKAPSAGDGAAFGSSLSLDEPQLTLRTRAFRASLGIHSEPGRLFRLIFSTRAAPLQDVDRLWARPSIAAMSLSSLRFIWPSCAAEYSAARAPWRPDVSAVTRNPIDSGGSNGMNSSEIAFSHRAQISSLSAIPSPNVRTHVNTVLSSLTGLCKFRQILWQCQPLSRGEIEFLNCRVASGATVAMLPSFNHVTLLSADPVSAEGDSATTSWPS
jgi:hypothetical protein